MNDHLPRPAPLGFALPDASRPAAPFVVLSRSVRFHATFAGGETTTGFAGLAPDGAEDYTALAGQNGTMQEVAQGQQADNAQVPAGASSVSVQGSAGTSVSLAAPSLGAAATRGGGIIVPQCTHHALDSYYATDHLGTVRFVKTVDDNSGIVTTTTHDYEPFGVEITPTDACDNTHKFTGHERDLETGNDYMHFRFYGASIGRFQKPDSNFDHPIENPQGWNLYSYVKGNPVNFNDPTGHQAVDPPHETAKARGPDSLPKNPADPNWQAHDQSQDTNSRTAGDPTKQKEQPKPAATTPSTPAAQSDGPVSKFLNMVGTFLNNVEAAVGLNILPVNSVMLTDDPPITQDDVKALDTVAKVADAADAMSSITSSDDAMQHVIDRHTEGGAQVTENSSIFNKGEDLNALVKSAEGTPAVQQSGGNYERVVDAGRTIGTDNKYTGGPTSTYTVITDKNGNLVTTFPGKP